MTAALSKKLNEKSAYQPYEYLNIVLHINISDSKEGSQSKLMGLFTVLWRTLLGCMRYSNLSNTSES